MDTDLERAVRAAGVAELCWTGEDPGAPPGAAPVTPLLLGGEPAVAFPYAEATRARQVAAAATVALVISDDRMTGQGWRPLVVTGRPRLIPDRDGELFCDRLLDQELRKYPPARALIDSPLLRREHWWFLPRLIVAIEVSSQQPVGVRGGGRGEVLAVVPALAELAVDTVTPQERAADHVRVSSLAGGWPPAGPAVLLGHDFSVPDLERWTPWVTSGWWREGVVTVVQQPERTELEPTPGLWRRWQRQRRLERGCRRGLAQESV